MRTHSMGFYVEAVDRDGKNRGVVGSLSSTCWCPYGYITQMDDEAGARAKEEVMKRGLQRRAPIYVISGLTVMEECRGMGLGTAIMSLFIAQFPGTHTVMAETAEKPWLRKFYESIEFHEIEEVDGDIVMVRVAKRPPTVTIEDGKISVSLFSGKKVI